MGFGEVWLSAQHAQKYVGQPLAQAQGATYGELTLAEAELTDEGARLDGFLISSLDLVAIA